MARSSEERILNTLHVERGDTNAIKTVADEHLSELNTKLYSSYCFQQMSYRDSRRPRYYHEKRTENYLIHGDNVFKEYNPYATVHRTIYDLNTRMHAPPYKCTNNHN